MPTVHFYGRVFPPCGLTMTPAAQVPSLDPTGDLSFTMTVFIKDSDVGVECELNRDLKDGELVFLHLHAFKIARSFVDLFAFSNGMGLTLILDNFTDASGKSSVILPIDQDLATSCTIAIPVLIQLSIWRPDLQRAMHLLASTLDRPNVVPVNCAQAIESVAKMISPGEQNKAKQWAQMREKLNVTEAYLKFITDLSKKPRHGDFDEPPTEDKLEARRRAWIVMNRYLEFLNRGGVASLYAPEFPEA